MKFIIPLVVASTLISGCSYLHKKGVKNAVEILNGESIYGKFKHLRKVENIHYAQTKHHVMLNSNSSGICISKEYSTHAYMNYGSLLSNDHEIDHFGDPERDDSCLHYPGPSEP